MEYSLACRRELTTPSAQHLLGILEQLRERGVAFRSVTEGMDTSTYMGRFVFTVLGPVAEMEREIIRERVNAGLAAARQRGRVGGRLPPASPFDGLAAVAGR